MGFQPSDPTAIVPTLVQWDPNGATPCCGRTLPPSVLTRTTATLCGRRLGIRHQGGSQAVGPGQRRPTLKLQSQLQPDGLCTLRLPPNGILHDRVRVTRPRGLRHLDGVGGSSKECLPNWPNRLWSGVALRSSNTILRLRTAGLPSPTSLVSLRHATNPGDTV